jgi:hypothetical protein
MKPLIICLTCSLLFFQNIKSQDNLKFQQTKTHHALLARIIYTDEQTMMAHIMNFKDSAIYVYENISGRPDPFHKINIYAESNWNSYNYRTIESIKVRKQGLRAWLLPVSIVGGVLAGGLIGSAVTKNADSFESLNNEWAGIVIGSILGAGVGLATGLIICNESEKKYLINGDWKSFEEMKKMMKY